MHPPSRCRFLHRAAGYADPAADYNKPESKAAVAEALQLLEGVAP